MVPLLKLFVFVFIKKGPHSQTLFVFVLIKKGPPFSNFIILLRRVPPSQTLLDFDFIKRGGGIITHFRLGQVHRPTIVFLPYFNLV